MLPLALIAPASKYVFYFSKRQSLQETQDPDLEGFFNIEFDQTGNPTINIENIR